MKIPDNSSYTQGASVVQELISLSQELTVAHEELERAAFDYAVKDNDMRKAKSKAFLRTEGKNKEEREAKADADWAEARLACSLAEADKEVCLEKVRSLRAQLSALQALLYSRKAEADAIKMGQTQTT